MKQSLKIENLSVKINGKEILSNINLQVKVGEVHAIMGPNGSGKSSLALALMGYPTYSVKGEARIGRKNLLKLSPEKRARTGLFLAFQTPIAVYGVNLLSYLKEAKKAQVDADSLDVFPFYKKLLKDANSLGLSEEFLERPLNDGFSGGEKKKVEILALLALKPKFIIFDEIDTGLDIDSLRMVASIINKLRKGSGIVLITHYARILKLVKADFVHIFKKGRIIAAGGANLAFKVERRGYANIQV